MHGLPNVIFRVTCFYN